MNNNVVVISTVETFSVRGIEMKLKGIGSTPVYAPLETQELDSL